MTSAAGVDTIIHIAKLSDLTVEPIALALQVLSHQAELQALTGDSG